MKPVETLFTNIAETVNNRELSIRTAVWENGRDLVGVRDVLKPQGLWVQWQEKCLRISRQSVNNYIALYEAYPECQTILQDNITLAMMYTIARKPDPQLELQAVLVQQKAKQGEKLTTPEINIILDKNDVQKPEIRAAIHAANDVSPQLTRDIAITGAITKLDGDDIPIAQADETLIQYSANTERYERVMRHVETEPYEVRVLSARSNGNKTLMQIEIDTPFGTVEKLTAYVRKQQVTEVRKSA